MERIFERERENFFADVYLHENKSYVVDNVTGKTHYPKESTQIEDGLDLYIGPNNPIYKSVLDFQRSVSIADRIQSRYFSNLEHNYPYIDSKSRDVFVNYLTRN